jgi:P4 family phage/plasmid primase-like protien
MNILAFDKINPGVVTDTVNTSAPPAFTLGKPLGVPHIIQLDGKPFIGPDLPTARALSLAGGPGSVNLARFPVTPSEAVAWLAARRVANDQPAPATEPVSGAIYNYNDLVGLIDIRNAAPDAPHPPFQYYEQINMGDVCVGPSCRWAFVGIGLDASGRMSMTPVCPIRTEKGVITYTYGVVDNADKLTPYYCLRLNMLTGVFAAVELGVADDPEKFPSHRKARVDNENGDELSLIAVSFPNCRNPDTGQVTPTAETLIKALGSYAQIGFIKTDLEVLLAVAIGEMDQVSRLLQKAGPNHDLFREQPVYVIRKDGFFTFTGNVCHKHNKLRIISSRAPVAEPCALDQSFPDDGTHISSYSASGAAAMFADATVFASNRYGTEGVLTVPPDRDDGRKILEVHFLPTPTNKKEREFYSRRNGFQTHCYSHEPTWDHPDDRAFVVETLGLGKNGTERTVSQEEAERRKAEAEAKRQQKNDDQKARVEDFESYYIFSDTCRADDDPKENPASTYLRDTRRVVINPESGAKLTYYEPRWKKVDGESVFDGFVENREPKLVVPRHDFVSGEIIGYELERLSVTHVDGGVVVKKGAFFRDVARLTVGVTTSYMLARAGTVGTDTLAVGEGFITTVSGSMLPITAISGAAVWALGGKSNFGHLAPSLPFTKLFIFVDSDTSEGGERSALNLADRWRKAGKAVTLVRFPVPADHPDAGGDAVKFDANDLIRHCAAKGREPVEGSDFTLEEFRPVVQGPTALEVIQQTALIAPIINPPAEAVSNDQPGTEESDDEEDDDDQPEVVVTPIGDNSGERAADLGNARRFVRFCDDNVRYVHEWKTWFIWTGEYWERDNSGQINRLAHACVDQMYRDAVSITDQVQRDAQLKHAMKSHGKTPIDNMVGLARDMVPLAASALDSDPFLLGVQNGVVNLKTGKLRESRKTDYITKRANVVFDANATCPNWDAFQDKISGGNEELVAFKQRMYGLALSGKIMELLFTLYGDGSNGKSTEVTTYLEIAEDYACVSDQYLIMERSSKDRGATPEIVALKGKRGVVINETSEGDVLDDRAVKRCTSNEPITGRGLYEGLTTFMPTHTTLLLTNHKPRIRGTDYGIWRRLAYVPYPVTISASEKIEHYRERFLVPEASGILNWMLAGWRHLYKNGMKLDFPKVVTDAAEEYKKEQNTVRQFVDVCCATTHPKEQTALAVLHVAYQRWIETEYGYRGRGRNKMSEELVEIGRKMNFYKDKDSQG